MKDRPRKKANIKLATSVLLKTLCDKKSGEVCSIGVCICTQLVLSWWCCLERLWNLSKWSLAGGSTSLWVASCFMSLSASCVWMENVTNQLLAPAFLHLCDGRSVPLESQVKINPSLCCFQILNFIMTTGKSPIYRNSKWNTHALDDIHHCSIED